MESIILDKTADGQFWILDRWIDNDWVLRLRFKHTINWDPCAVQAEVGIKTDPMADYGESMLWKPLGEPFLFALGTPECEAESVWTEDFPRVLRPAFVELGRVLGRIGQHLDLGPALGPLQNSAVNRSGL